MNDLIYRDQAIEAISKLPVKVDNFGYTWMIAGDVLKQIDGIPSAKPERKKGKWIDGMLYYDFDESEWEKVKCSVCENFVTKQIFYHDNKYHYCPYCGADMRGK